VLQISQAVEFGVDTGLYDSTLAQLTAAMNLLGDYASKFHFDYVKFDIFRDFYQVCVSVCVCVCVCVLYAELRQRFSEQTSATVSFLLCKSVLSSHRSVYAAGSLFRLCVYRLLGCSLPGFAGRLSLRTTTERCFRRSPLTSR